MEKYENISKLLKNEIKEQYGNLHNFATNINMSYQTIYSIFKRGIQKASFTSISQICEKLGIDIDTLLSEQIIVKIEDTERYKNDLITSKIKQLDDNQKKMLMDYLELLISAKGNDKDD